MTADPLDAFTDDELDELRSLWMSRRMFGFLVPWTDRYVEDRSFDQFLADHPRLTCEGVDGRPLGE